jgi:polar amino acid transport system substrate-binding protein
MKKFSAILVLILSLSILYACATGTGTMTASSSSPVIDRILKKGELTVGTAAMMPPLNMTTKDGRIIGLEADLARYMADSMGVNLKLKAIQFSKLLPALESGQIDMILSGMTMTSMRNLKVAFVGPYYVSGKGVLTNVATLASVTDPNALDEQKFKIAALEGSTSAEFVRKIMSKATLVTTKDYDEAVVMVIQGRVDAMVADHPICVISVARYPQHNLFSIIAPFTYEPIGIALPANDPLLANWVTNFLNKLEDSGVMDNVRDRWFNDTSWFNKLP